MAKHINGKTRRRLDIKARRAKRAKCFAFGFRTPEEFTELAEQTQRLGSARRVRDYFLEQWARVALGRREVALP